MPAVYFNRQIAVDRDALLQSRTGEDLENVIGVRRKNRLLKRGILISGSKLHKVPHGHRRKPNIATPTIVQNRKGLRLSRELR